MRKYNIHSIPRILENKDQYNEKLGPNLFKFLKDNNEVVLIFITCRTDYDYNLASFGSTPFLDLFIADTNAPIIGINNIASLKFITKYIKNNNIQNIYICCDAGLSRSPAVAAFLAFYLKDGPQYMKLRDEKFYPHLNLSLLQELFRCFACDEEFQKAKKYAYNSVGEKYEKL